MHRWCGDHATFAFVTMMRDGFFEGTEMPDAGWWTALWPDPAGVLAAVGLRPGMDVVDLCSGDGWFTREIAGSARRVTAIEIDEALLEQSRIRLGEAGIDNCGFIVGDACNIVKLLARPVDFVFLANAFHGVPDKARLCEAVAEGLVEGGQFAVVNWHKRPREETVVLGQPRGPRTALRIDADEVAAIGRAAGLVPVNVVEIPPYHYGVTFRREAKQD